MRSDRTVRAAFTVLALVVASGMSATAHAQYVAELTPFFTSYYPLGEIDFTGSSDDVYAKQKSSPGVGARLTFWLSNTLGIEAAGAYLWSSPTVFINTPEYGAVSADISGTIINTTGRVVFRPARTNLFLLGGAGMVIRGGDAWEDEEKTSALAGVVGFGARANITPKFAMNVVVEGTFYSLDADGSDDDGGTFWQASTQSDIMVTIGIPIGFGRR
jgi:hypothetical protein